MAYTHGFCMKLIAVIVSTRALEASRRPRPRKQHFISIYHCFIGISANHFTFLDRRASLGAAGGSRGKTCLSKSNHDFDIQPNKLAGGGALVSGMYFPYRDYSSIRRIVN